MKLTLSGKLKIINMIDRISRLKKKKKSQQQMHLTLHVKLDRKQESQ